MTRKQQLVAYARRDWGALAEVKQQYWRTCTPAERVAAAEELRERARSTHPDWPSQEDRERDLAAHIQLAELLRRAAFKAR